MEHNIDLIKQIRDEYAKEEGYESFASMAGNVNIVPSDITEIAKKYAEGMTAALQARCDRYEKALKSIEVLGDGATITHLRTCKKVATEALASDGEKKEAGKPVESVQDQPDLGNCQRCGITKATTTYNDLKVCAHCDKMLNNEFDDEYR